MVLFAPVSVQRVDEGRMGHFLLVSCSFSVSVDKVVFSPMLTRALTGGRSLKWKRRHRQVFLSSPGSSFFVATPWTLVLIRGKREEADCYWWCRLASKMFSSFSAKEDGRLFCLCPSRFIVVHSRRERKRGRDVFSVFFFCRVKCGE